MKRKGIRDFRTSYLNRKVDSFMKLMFFKVQSKTLENFSLLH